jgi:hypothetical protein
VKVQQCLIVVDEVLEAEAVEGEVTGVVVSGFRTGESDRMIVYGI